MYDTKLRNRSALTDMKNKNKLRSFSSNTVKKYIIYDNYKK